MPDSYPKAAPGGDNDRSITLLDQAISVRGLLVARPRGFFSNRFDIEVEYEDIVPAGAARPR